MYIKPFLSRPLDMFKYVNNIFFQADQSHTELNNERSNSQRIENQRTSLERQVINAKSTVCLLVFVLSY